MLAVVLRVIVAHRDFVILRAVTNIAGEKHTAKRSRASPDSELKDWALCTVEHSFVADGADIAMETNTAESRAIEDFLADAAVFTSVAGALD